MNTEPILDLLDTYNTRELFYRKCPQQKDAPDEGAVTMTEADCFEADGGSTVVLAKLDRFAPPVLHMHEFFEFIYVLRGSCVHHIFGRDEHLKAGDLCLLSPAMAHSVCAGSDDLVLLIRLRLKDMENIFYNVLRDSGQISDFLLNSLYLKDYATCLTFHVPEDREIREQILEMYAEQQQHGDLYSDRILCGMLAILFHRLARSHPRMADVPPETDTNSDAAQFLHYILQDYRTITLSALAKNLNYSVPYCSRHIKEVTGYTFLQLLQRIRFQKAESYLLSSTLSIQKISALLGYENPENFIRAFKKIYGVSPARFRAQH